MAVTVTQVGRRTVFGDRRVGIYVVEFSGNYATGGEAVTAASFGMNYIDAVFSDTAMASDEATAVVLGYEPTDASSGQILVYESGAANAPLAEKANAEAYITGQAARVMVIGA